MSGPLLGAGHDRSRLLHFYEEQLFQTKIAEKQVQAKEQPPKKIEELFKDKVRLTDSEKESIQQEADSRVATFEHHISDMLSMPKSAPVPLKYGDIVAKTSAALPEFSDDRKSTQMQLLKSLIMQRLGIDVSGAPWGIDSEKAQLRLAYMHEAQKAQARKPENEQKTEQQLSTNAVNWVKEFEQKANEALDTCFGAPKQQISF